MADQVPETPVETTMQDVYNQSGIEAQAQEFNQQTPAQQAPAAYVAPIPDPTLDPQGFQNYQSQQTASQNFQVQQLQAELGKVNDQLTGFEQSRQQETLKADINEAVTTLEKSAAGIDRNILLGQLHVRANNDPLFAQIWENRTQNPQALANALGVIGADISKTLPTVDPDVAEAQRALNNATTSMTTDPKSEEDRFDDLSDGDFLAEMRKVGA